MLNRKILFVSRQALDVCIAELDLNSLPILISALRPNSCYKKQEIRKCI